MQKLIIIKAIILLLIIITIIKESGADLGSKLDVMFSRNP